MGLKNKRGFFFVFLTLFLLSIFVLSFSIYSNISERKAVQTRVDSINSFIFSIEKDLSRELYVFGYRTIFLIENKIVSSGNYISDLNLIFQSAFENGTFEGKEDQILSDANKQYFSQITQERANKINANITISSKNFSVDQIDPWNVRLVWNMEVNVTDNGGLAEWKFNEQITSFIPIANFEDPMYFIETNGLVSQKIAKNPYSPLYTSGGSTTNLSAYLLNKYYNSSNKAPSFLNRLEGNYSANENGIESFVYLPDLSKQGINIAEKSIIDYVYFSDNNPTPLCTLGNLPTWFKIDSANAARYNISC